MFDFKNKFKGKKITQVGLGLLGRGVGDADFLAKCGADLTVTDLKTKEQLKTSVGKLKKYKNITFHLGEHKMEDFSDKDLILKGAGVPLNSPYINEARKNNIPVDMSASLLLRLTGIPSIGITGTRGKSTVTNILYEILKADGRDVFLGGNVKGVSNLSLLDNINTDSIGVFELDSWQCQGLGEERTINIDGIKQGFISPEVAVFTTFMPDHLNYYKNGIDDYLADKANIFLHQTSSDVLVVGTQALPHLEKYKNKIKSNVIVADENTVPKKWNILMPGKHNRYNAGIAVAVAREYGVDDLTIRKVVENIKALPGRLEFVKNINGIDVYNDTNATTPEATVAAISSFENSSEKVILISGGADKGLDFSVLDDAIKKNIKNVVFLAGSGTEKMFKKYDYSYKVFSSLEDAVKQAFEFADAGDIVLFSPAFASFGMFKNEYDRGERFVDLINKLR
jgi:UDP-N-acetylmuramoylalanine--D-glutamate ligase